MKRSPRVPNKVRGVKAYVWSRVGYHVRLATLKALAERHASAGH
jgi:hypothetical protein